MKFNYLFLIALIGTCAIASERQSTFKFNNENVTVRLAEDETVNQAVNRAKEVMTMNAIAKTPRFVSLKTHYDSSTDKVIEKGLIAQGANVSIYNVKHALKAGDNSHVNIDVTGDVIVDVSAMLEKLSSEKREKLMQSVIDDMHVEQQQLEAVLTKVRNQQSITKTDSIKIKNYNTTMNTTFSMVSGDVIMEKLNGDKNGTSHDANLKARVIQAYEMFVFPFIKNAKINYEVIDIKRLEHAVAEIKVKVTIDRRVGHEAETEAFVPTVSNGFRLEDCEVFFEGCERLIESRKSIFYENGKPFPKWFVHQLLVPKYCGRSIYEYLPVDARGMWVDGVYGQSRVECGASFKWIEASMRPLIDFISSPKVNFGNDVLENRDIYTAALKEVSRRGFWLRIDIGQEAFHIDITDPTVNEFIFSAYQPISWVEDGIKIKTSVREEEYSVDNSTWSDMNGNILRYQSRQIKFY